LLNLLRQQITARAFHAELQLISTTSPPAAPQPRHRRNDLPLPRSSIPAKLNRCEVLATN
jgi:hypothetical protein